MDPQIGWWDWVGIGLGILGTVAFVMAVQPFTQAIWGRPKPVIEFKEQLSDAGKLLVGTISHVPITNRVLRWLRVYRMTLEKATIIVWVSEDRTDEVKMEYIPPLMVGTETLTSPIDIPARLAGLPNFPIVTTLNDGKTFVGKPGTGQKQLGAGLYMATVGLHAGERNYLQQRKFMVGAHPESLYWIKS